MRFTVSGISMIAMSSVSSMARKIQEETPLVRLQSSATKTRPLQGGSYVIVQKYLHNMKAWNGLSIEAQEHIIGRRKLSDIELSDAEKPASAHNALTVIEENGKELKILRDNMPFGRPGHGEFGTYFIGYSRTPRITETMLQNMFVGRPPGNYDRLLDFSRAVTGSLFFVPSATFLDNISGEAPDSNGNRRGADSLTHRRPRPRTMDHSR